MYHTYHNYRLSITPIFYYKYTPTSKIYTLSLHDALPIYAKYGYKGSDRGEAQCRLKCASMGQVTVDHVQSRNYLRSEEHTSELQSRRDLVCRLLLEKKNNGQGN